MPPVLLTVGHFYGTLAAARCLGRAGIPVTLAEGHALAPARWSRYVSRRVPCPDVAQTDAFLAWLRDFGARWPGHVLLPTSDDMAWLFAEEREALSASFRMLPTPFEAVAALLDKHALVAHCRAVGLDVPETWFPTSEDEAAAMGREAGLPLLIKPRTQVLHPSGMKGVLVTSMAELVPRFREMSAHDGYGERVRRRRPDVVWPMLQRYYPSANENIYGIEGYAGPGGEILGARAARKILQRPRKLGIGLCFEEAPLDAALVDKIGALCKRVGYEGVFEVELIEIGSRAVVIDFNPRFYSQMAFDVDRGLPLPRLAYAGALGDREALYALAAEAQREQPSHERVYCHHVLFEVMLRAQRLSGHLRADEEQRWRRWWAEHRGAATDAVADARDPAPLGVDVIAHLTWFARHPRSFVRSMVLDR